MKNEQIVIWMGTVVGEENIVDFENWLHAEGFPSAKYLTEFTIIGGTRNDVLFSLSLSDFSEIQRFALWRLFQFNGEMKWWEDFLDNGGNGIVPDAILEDYPYGWDK